MFFQISTSYKQKIDGTVLKSFTRSECMLMKFSVAHIPYLGWLHFLYSGEKTFVFLFFNRAFALACYCASNNLAFTYWPKNSPLPEMIGYHDFASF